MDNNLCLSRGVDSANRHRIPVSYPWRCAGGCPAYPFFVAHSPWLAPPGFHGFHETGIQYVEVRFFLFLYSRFLGRSRCSADSFHHFLFCGHILIPLLHKTRPERPAGLSGGCVRPCGGWQALNPSLPCPALSVLPAFLWLPVSSAGTTGR